MNESSLFRSLPVRSGRMTIIFTASVFAHTCLVGVGAVLWQSTEPPPKIVVRTTTVTIEDPPLGKPEIPPGGPVEPAPPVSTVTPPPEVEPPVEAVMPPSIEPMEMTEPTIPPKPRPAIARTARANTLTSAVRASAAAPGAVSNGLPGAGVPNGVSSGSLLGWKTPRPPYPRSQLMSRVQGSTTVHFTTDASGNVTSASIVKSTGNAALDASTLSYVRANWRGPANASRTTEFVYQIP